MDSTNTNSASAIPLVIRSGLIITLLSIIFQFIQYYSGFMEKAIGWPGYIFDVIDCVIVLLLIKKFRDTQMGGAITFKKAFGITFQSFLFAGVISSVFNFIFFKYMHPEVMDSIMKVSEQKLVAQGLPDDQIENSLKVTKFLMTNPVVSILFFILIYAFMGAISGLIVAAIVKKESKVFLPDVNI